MTKRIPLILLSFVGLSGCMWVQTSSDDPLCKAALEALPKGWQGGRACSAVPAGVVIGHKGEVEGLSPLLTEARARYVDRLGGDPKRIAFIVGMQLPPEVHFAVTQRGALAFNWPSMRGQKEAFVRAMRKEVESNFAHAPRADRERLLRRMVDNFDETVSEDGAPSALEGGTIQHELAHQWFIQYFDEGARADPLGSVSTKRYGSKAPDWLDEAAAILVENAFLDDNRRKALAKIMRSPAPELLPTLAEFTALPHPARPDSKDAYEPSESNISITVNINTRTQQANVQRDTSWFYTMTRALIDFLIEKTGDDMVIRAISDEVRRGGDLFSWLEKSPYRSALGGDRNGAEKLWAEWLDSKRPTA